MGDSRAALQTALKVLSALTAGRAVNPSDVRALRKISTLTADAKLDDVACDVAQKVLAFRAGSMPKRRA